MLLPLPLPQFRTLARCCKLFSECFVGQVLAKYAGVVGYRQILMRSRIYMATVGIVVHVKADYVKQCKYSRRVWAASGADSPLRLLRGAHFQRIFVWPEYRPQITAHSLCARVCVCVCPLGCGCVCVTVGARTRIDESIHRTIFSIFKYLKILCVGVLPECNKSTVNTQKKSRYRNSISSSA